MVPYEEPINAKAELKELNSKVHVLAKALESTNELAEETAARMGVRKTVQLKPSRTIFSKKASATKVLAITNAPPYIIQTAKGRAVYDKLMDLYDDMENGEAAALEGAEEADKEELQRIAGLASSGGAGLASSGGAGGSAPTTEERLQQFADLHTKAIAAKDVKTLHAMIDNLAAIAATDKNTAAKKGKLVNIFKKNKEDYGFGICEFAQNPFAPIDQAEVDAFEDFKKHYGFPAGKWDGRLNPI